MPTKLKVKIEYEIEVDDNATVPSDLEWLIKGKVLNSLDYGANLFWQLLPDTVKVKVARKWL